MRLILIGILFLYASVVNAINSSFDPQWVVGDMWSVRYTFQSMLDPKEDNPITTEVSTDILYIYTVDSITVENNRNVWKILVEPEEGYSDWLLTFDEEELTLVSVEEIISPAEQIKHENPFDRDAWMSNFDQYLLLIIHDFPLIPDSSVDEIRNLTPDVSGTPEFTQSTTFLVSQATIIQSRTDPVSLTEHKTTIVWDSGQKWWSSAITELDGDIKVSGVLE